MVNNKMVHMASFMLVVVGGVNWGLVGLLNLDLVHLIFGSFAPLDRIVYILVGAAAVYLVMTHKNDCKVCAAKGSN